MLGATYKVLQFLLIYCPRITRNVRQTVNGPVVIRIHICGCRTTSADGLIFIQVYNKYRNWQRISSRCPSPTLTLTPNPKHCPFKPKISRLRQSIEDYYYAKFQVIPTGGFRCTRTPTHNAATYTHTHTHKHHFKQWRSQGETLVHVPPSPLKDRYAFSICLQLLGAKAPDPTGALPLDPAGGFRPLCSPSKFLATPLISNSSQYRRRRTT